MSLRPALRGTMSLVPSETASALQVRPSVSGVRLPSRPDQRHFYSPSRGCPDHAQNGTRIRMRLQVVTSSHSTG
jgi:hypothetical protein